MSRPTPEQVAREGRILRTICREIVYYVAIIAVVCAALALAPGCASVAADGAAASAPGRDRVHTERNTYGTVYADGCFRVLPPKLRFTGRTVTGAEIRRWAADHGIRAVGVYADEQYAQIESKSAIRLVLWLKAFQRDIGYTYIGGSRDCEQFAKVARTLPDLFARGAPGDAQALIFGIFATMDEPFAGVSDGYHALNVAWTDRGVPVFEPQGEDLVYQDIRAWPNKEGITHFQTE